ncbi:MAG: SDR family NAD(P)-dependent oxidoreductase [Steroidobacteraceae bacterium]|jgi:NAD(P)-dependent dehydrogenase (short-subunit alcohol dehydrogenase family)
MGELPDLVPALDSFRPDFRALVWGASGGIGGAFVATLAANPRIGEVMGASRRAAAPWTFDLEDEDSIAAVAKAASADGPLDLVLVATGVLLPNPEKTWRQLDSSALARAYAINAIGPALIAKHTLGSLRRDSKAVFACISARVGSIDDNRLGGWHAYRASKAALNMLVRNWAIELRQRNPSAVCIALHPGTVDTALSRPFQSAVDPTRLQSPVVSVRRMLTTINALGAADSGKLWAYDGSLIAF